MIISTKNYTIIECVKVKVTIDITYQYFMDVKDTSKINQ